MVANRFSTLDGSTVAVELIQEGKRKLLRGVAAYCQDPLLGRVLKVNVREEWGDFDFVLGESEWDGADLARLSTRLRLPDLHFDRLHVRPVILPLRRRQICGSLCAPPMLRCYQCQLGVSQSTLRIPVNAECPQSTQCSGV